MSGLRAARLSELIIVTGGSVYGGNSRDEETFRFYQLSDISSCTGASIWRNNRSLVRDRNNEKGALLPCGRWPQPILLWYCKTNKKQLSSPPSSPPLFLDFVNGPFVALSETGDLAPSDQFLDFSFPSYDRFRRRAKEAFPHTTASGGSVCQQ